MADQLTDDQISEFKEAFHNFDKDSDGRITPKELAEVFKALGYTITEQETTELIKEIDEKGESVDFYEFLNIIARKLKDIDNGEELLAAFKVFDKDGVGTVSVAELRYEMTKLNEKMGLDEIEELIKEIDIFGDGNIKYNEWVESAMKILKS